VILLQLTVGLEVALHHGEALLQPGLDLVVVCDQQAATALRGRRQRRIQKLKDERQKLLDGYYAGAIPLDMLKTEQDRIGRGLAAAEDRLGKLTGQFDHIEEVITRAMAWVDSLHEAYQAATEQVRRLLNQALYTQMFISQDGVMRVAYTEGFAWLLGEEDEESAASEDQAATVAGQNEVRLEAAVVVRFERAGRCNDKRPGRRAGAHARGSLDHGWNVKRFGGAGGNRTLVRSVQTPRATTVPEIWT
jgi:hypothetical protein